MDSLKNFWNQYKGAIIGIIIAVLLGLVILTVAAVLFVPIRYVVKAQYKDGIPVIQAKVTWLFHLLRIKCLFNLEEGLKRIYFLINQKNPLI